ncbi:MULTISPECIES: DNA (cytosine-5-)-methyltransferase [unclassified Pseudoalteromonas]|uniref:DNA (cytosine-5-)-methyltransferase n=1 Tax=unclassified Pseudoalteromonas TaxID=194690 RepID=UPI00110A771B|nr:DNA (cytosine-5-)-methyltransferase [Pseudoalteromonas sp. S558]TMO02440.1 DNA (cytosine-5-)-methyltransferase [Pseudoalteromonas sp. S558]
MQTALINKDIAKKIRSIREGLGLGRTEFANLLGMASTGERTVRGWETGEHKPTAKKLVDILNLESQLKSHLDNAPFKQKALSESEFTFIDLFAGIGGIRLPFQKLGGHCVFTSEWDKFAQKTYLTNYGEMPNGDITKVAASDIPDHDILLGGFPCQAFSQAGLKQGFSDTRGTMFFEIQRILTEKKPKVFVLENVKQLQGHDKGRTLNTILDILRGNFDLEIPDDVPLSEETRHALSEKLNYWVDYKVLRAGDFGVPQNRERVFIVGFNKNHFKDCNFDELFNWPIAPKTPTKVGDILEDFRKITSSDDKFTISEKIWVGHQRRRKNHEARGNGFGYSIFNAQSQYTNTISARYYKDGSEILIDQSELGKRPRKLTPRECARLQGFPEEYIIDAVSQGQIYKQFGNSVCMKVVDALAKQVVKALLKGRDQV